MYRRAAIAALFLQAALRAFAQLPAVETEPGIVTLKSTSRAVQVDVFVSDASGHPVHGLQKGDFVVTDKGRPREIRIFDGEIEADQTAAGVYSNRIGTGNARIVTAMVIDAVPRPEGLQQNAGVFALNRPEFWIHMMRAQAEDAIHRMAPGQVMAIYAACPDLRVVQDYTSDPDRLVASLRAFVPPPLPRVAGKKQVQTIEALVAPMLSALRAAASGMSGATGRKSVVWISLAYGTELNPSFLSAATDSTIGVFNDANVTLYAVDTRFSPTCESPAWLPDKQSEMVNLTCSQPPDISDQWMRYLAQATGGRLFSGGKVSGMRWRDTPSRTGGGSYRIERGDHGLVSDAIRFTEDESGYELGFYVAEAELDGEVHALRVTVPGQPKLGLNYRRGYTASASVTALPVGRELNGSRSNRESAGGLVANGVGIEGRIDAARIYATGGQKEVQVSLALAPETVTRTADNVTAIEVIITQTDASGRQVAKMSETVHEPMPEVQSELVRFSRAVKLNKDAVLLHVRILDQATNRVGSIAIPIGKP